MKFAIFGLSASVDIRQLPGAWVAELLGVVLGVQDHKLAPTAGFLTAVPKPLWVSV